MAESRHSRHGDPLEGISELAGRIADHPALWHRGDDVRARTARTLLENVQDARVANAADRRWLGRIRGHLERLLTQLDGELIEA